MGVFTEQVQRLATEQEILRKERQEKRELKRQQEEAERNLYYKLENTFTRNSITKKGISKNFESKKDMYNFLLQFEIKNTYIYEITKNIDIQYYLDKKYLIILKKIYAPYKEQEKEKEKEEKEKQKQYNNSKKQYYLSVLQGRTTLIKKRKYKPLLFFYYNIKIYIFYMLLF